MSRYIDVHALADFSEKTLETPNSPKDEFGVTHVNLIYTVRRQVFCVLDATNKKDVEKNHLKFGVKCEWIIGVKTTS